MAPKTGKHTITDGDAVLQAAKERREKEIEEIRAAEVDAEEVIPASWVKRDTAFPPYLQFYVGMQVRCRPIWRDERQVITLRDGTERKFVRYHLELLAPKAIECRRGPVDERGTPVAVRKGQVFSVGAVVGLENEFNALIGLDMGFQCIGERPLKDDPDTGEPRKMYDFETFISPDLERQLVSENKEDQERLRVAYRSARQMARENNVRLLMASVAPVTNGQPAQQQPVAV